MDVYEHERLYNITFRTDWSKRTWETTQHYTQTQIEVTQQLVIRKHMDVYEHERL